MAQFNRFSGDLAEADRYLTGAEEAVGPFVLLNMDCLVERAWLHLDQGNPQKAREKWLIARNLADRHRYHRIDKELKELEQRL
jgi:hypothetical protein